MIEKHLQSNIITALRKIDGCVVWSHIATPFSPTGHSDLYGTIHGYGFWGEVKLPGKGLSEIQKAFLKQVGKGVLFDNTFVWDSVEQAVEDVLELSYGVEKFT